MKGPFNNFPTKVYLSGADCFFLAMEKHYQKYNTSGNTCHLLISCEGKISKDFLLEKIKKIPFFDWLYKIKLKTPGFFRLPYWEYNSLNEYNIIIEEIADDKEKIPISIIQKGIFLKDESLFRFTLNHTTNNTTNIIFSWHHILMDAKGAETLLKILGNVIPEEKVILFPPKEKKVNIFKALYTLHFSKEFVKKSSKKPLVQLVSGKIDYVPISKFHIIEFNEEQTKELDTVALKNGAHISKGSFYLASTTKAINNWLIGKGNTKGTFWIPVPQNRRLKGKYGPIISNLQSFMFYRIPREKLHDLKSCTEFITKEMFELIRHKKPEEYAVMSDVLRYIPSNLYYFLISGPGGGSIASFLYSDPGVNEFKSFFGHNVTDITNYPPGTFPPGLMVIFERFNGKQKIIVNYTYPLVSNQDLTILEHNLKNELLQK